jgi:hypothetical protein
MVVKTLGRCRSAACQEMSDCTLFTFMVHSKRYGPGLPSIGA